jgi:hypothetical protein
MASLVALSIIMRPFGTSLYCFKIARAPFQINIAALDRLHPYTPPPPKSQETLKCVCQLPFWLIEMTCCGSTVSR